MERKRGRVGKGNRVLALSLCSRQLLMLLGNHPSLPAHVLLPPWPGWDGRKGHGPCTPLSPSGTSLQHWVQNANGQSKGRRSHRVVISARGGSAQGSKGLPDLTPSIPSAPSIPVSSQPHVLGRCWSRFGHVECFPWSHAGSSSSDAGFWRWAGAPFVLVVN